MGVFSFLQRGKRLTGIHIQGSSVWDVTSYELRRLLRTLPTVLPAGAVLCIEGVDIAEDVRGFLAAHPAPTTTQVYPGTIAPVPEVFHIPATAELLEAFARITDPFHDWEVCTHLHAYSDQLMLMQGYDFGSLPLIFSETMSEDQISHFCTAAGCDYAKRSLNDT